MKKRNILIGFVGLIVIIFAGFTIWAYTPAKPMPEVYQALKSDSQVKVDLGDLLVFTPIEKAPIKGLILYPGGRVDYRAYSPQAHAIASKGYLVVIVKMPFNLAVFGLNKAEKVFSRFPSIQTWSIGGHSLGGAMAADFAYKNPDAIKGLVLWASYPTSSDNLSNSDLKVISIYATLDGLATLDKINASKSLLPSNTIWLAIQGGDHAQFGWYGQQPGDKPATITRAEQQTQVISGTLNLLDQIIGVKK